MKFSQNTTPPTAQMQLAPMVDIVFLLLIFFIVTATIRDQERELEIKVPVADQAQERPQTVGQLVVNVREDGAIVLEGQEISEEDLLTRMNAISREFEEQAVIIRGDAATDFAIIASVVNTCAEAGIFNVTLAATETARE